MEIDGGRKAADGSRFWAANLPVHHDIGNVAIGQRGRVCLKLVCGSIGLLATQEDTRIRVHGRLTLGHLLVQLPDDNRLWVVLQVLAHTGNVLDHGNVQLLELVLGAKTGEQHETGSVHRASRQNGLGACVDGALGAVAQRDIDATDGVVVHIDLGNPRLEQDGQVGAVLLAAENRVDVRH